MHEANPQDRAGMSAGVLQSLLAAAPILLILVLMVGLRWPATRAGLAGLALALVLALGVFGLGRSILGELGVAAALAGVLAEALFFAATILWILLPALAIHNLQLGTGAVETMRVSLARLTADPRILALLVGYFFALFIEGAAGFGTPIALAAPFLAGAGFRRVEALVCTLIGHAIGVSFGAVGTPIQPQIRATPFSGLELSAATATYHALLGGVLLFFLWRTAGRGPGIAGGRGRAVWAALAGVCFIVPYFALARWVGPELPTLGGALVGGLVFVAFLMRWGGAATAAVGAPAPVAALLRAASPYLALIVAILATRLVAPLRDRLLEVSLDWTAFGLFEGSFQPLYHPGTMLFAGLLVGAAAQRVPVARAGAALGAAARQLVPVAVALIAMLGIARLMVHAGMIRALAELAAASVGAAWPAVAPLVGVLGTFVTGSATASNILLTDFQVVTAERLALPVLPLVGVQGFGAAVGNIICPHNIVAGAAAVGLTGGEGEVLRRTLLPCLLYTLLGGLLALLIVAGSPAA